MSQVLNGYGVLPGAYNDQANPIEGTPGRDYLARGYANPLLNQISTWTWTLSDTVGEVTATIRLPDGTLLSATDTDAGNTDTTHATTVVAKINSSDAWKNVATAANVAGVMTVTYKHAGFDYPFVSYAAPGAGVLTATSPETQAAGGIDFPVARWVIAAANAQDPDVPALALPAGAAATALIGVSLRPHGQIVNSLDASNTTSVSEHFIASDEVPVCFDGTVYMTNMAGATTVANGPVRVVVNTAGGLALGQVRSDATANTVTLSNNDAYWVSPTAVGARGLVRIRR